MPDPIGYRRWAIAGGHLDAEGDERVCILNASDDDAHVDVSVFFADREPSAPHRVDVPARRMVKVRISDLDVPRDADYAAVIDSEVPIVVQHGGIREHHFEYTTLAYAGD